MIAPVSCSGRANRVSQLCSDAKLAVAMAAALVCSFVPAQAHAQTAVSQAVNCSDFNDRANGVELVRSVQPIADFSIEIATTQKNNIRPADITILEGPCAGDVHAFRMTQIAFEDDAVFTAGFNGRFTYAPGQKGLTKSSRGKVSIGHPLIDQSTFMMATEIDSTSMRGETRSLEVALWKENDSYFIAVYTRADSGFSVPVELARSAQSIKSVTYFPSPDSNAGKLGLVVSDGKQIALVSLEFDHVALSKSLRHGK